ncbi:hypothetical protein GCM10027612_11270 [Microbispora bryophytorum subsp. camponoti]
MIGGWLFASDCPSRLTQAGVVPGAGPVAVQERVDAWGDEPGGGARENFSLAAAREAAANRVLLAGACRGRKGCGMRRTVRQLVPPVTVVPDLVM